MSSSVSAVYSLKESRRVWCGWRSRTYNHILVVHLHTSPTEQPTPPTIYSRAPELEGVGHKDALHSDGQQRKIISLCVFLHVCMYQCTHVYVRACVLVCAHTHRASHPLTCMACSRFSMDVLKQ